MAKTVAIERDSVLRALHHLEMLVPSLDKIGSHYANASEDDLRSVLGQFCLDWDLFKRLSEIRRLLSVTLDDQEVEKTLADLPTWEPTKKKPPPGV